MYKYLIIGMACMFVLAGGYYIAKSGGGELLRSALSSEKPDSFIPPSIQSVTGVYVCDSKSGCTKRYVLLLKEDLTAEIVLLDAEKNNQETDTVTEDTDNAALQNADTETTTGSSDVISTSTPSEDVSQTGQREPETGLEGVDVDTLLADKGDDESASTSIVDKGTWSIAVRNMLVITLNEQGTTTYDVPQKIVIKNVGSNTLSGISYTKSNYTDMIHPTFVKQDY